MQGHQYNGEVISSARRRQSTHILARNALLWAYLPANLGLGRLNSFTCTCTNLHHGFKKGKQNSRLLATRASHEERAQSAAAHACPSRSVGDGAALPSHLPSPARAPAGSLLTSLCLPQDSRCPQGSYTQQCFFLSLFLFFYF